MRTTLPWPTLVVEDQLLFRDLLVKLVAADARFHCVGLASDAVAGLDLCRQHQPHLILLDLNLPGMSGLELARRLRTLCPEARILALTAREDDSAIADVFELGLAGYVEKNQPIEVLEEAMLAVAQGRTYFTSTFAAARRRMARDPNALGKVLSGREREILRLVGNGHSGPQIARTLGLSPRTVGNHRYRLMKKLRLKNAAEVVAFALRNDP
jgi:two-component system secretion response regulator SsrB